MTIFAIEALAADPETQVIAVVSKTPSPEVAKKVLAALGRTPKPCVVHFVGDQPREADAGARHRVCRLARRERPSLPAGSPGCRGARVRPRFRTRRLVARLAGRLWPGVKLRGLFCGGTTGQEALALLTRAGLEVRSNLHKMGELRMDGTKPVAGHAVLDLGDDVFTRGRPHPMIEPVLRNERLTVEMADAEVGLLLFDVVLGYGAHPDPAGVLVAGVEAARATAGKRRREIVAIASVTGTPDDPQDSRAQARKLAAAGIVVARRQPAGGLARRGGAAEGRLMGTEKVRALFGQELTVVNLGLASFADELRRCGANAVQVDWRPTGGGDPAVVAALDACLGPGGEELAEIAAANQEAVGRVLQARPTLVGMGTAGDVIPGMHKDLDPALPARRSTWERMCGPTRGAVMGALIYEGLAATPRKPPSSPPPGEIEFAPCHHHHAVGPMAGIVTASMPVFILENKTFGNRAYCTQNEGLGKVLRYGGMATEVIERLHWMETRPLPGAATRRWSPCRTAST